MTQLKTLFLATLFFTCFSATAQDKQAGELSLEEIEAAMKTDERLIVIQLSTDWCVYCKMQDRQLSKDEEITQILENKTYYINLNAESKDTVKFNNTLYSPSSFKNGLHEFTLAVSGQNEQPSFPMWVIFNKDYEIIYRQTGLVKPKELTEVLKTLLSEASFLFLKKDSKE